MGSGRRLVFAFLACGLLLCSSSAEAQWSNPKLIAGQVGFHVAVTFFGKILQHERAGKAIREALLEGSFEGGLSHAGYCIAGRNPDWALVGKVLAQKASLSNRRSIQGRPVFDSSLWTSWELTHSFIHFEWDGKPRVQVDAINAAFSSYYLLKGKPYHFELKRSLLGGSLFFENESPPEGLQGYYLPGVVWVDAERLSDSRVWGHELVHSLQAERGASIADWDVSIFRVNFLVLASGAPALLAGWPDHDARFHEWEADLYSGTR